MMSHFDHHTPNSFCWADLSSTDIEASKSFYSQLFGWGIVEVPIDEQMSYTMFQKEGQDVCGASQMSPEMKQQGIPSCWMSHLSVADVAESTANVEKFGGKTLMPPFPVMQAGKMSVVQDPQGATLALWEPQASIGAQVMNEPNTLCWNELQTHNIPQSSAFYQELCGWDTKVSAAATGGDYFEFQTNQHSVAGMMQIRPEWGEVPPNWSIYFAVEDCNQTVDQVQKLGGRVIMPTTHFDIGDMAVVRDPQGAAFSLIQFAKAPASSSRSD
jgi:hypothetical protein